MLGYLNRCAVLDVPPVKPANFCHPEAPFPKSVVLAYIHVGGGTNQLLPSYFCERKRQVPFDSCYFWQGTSAIFVLVFRGASPWLPTKP